ncbi:hypothetical protein M569_10826, partial [Genlisea aurea]
MALQNIGASNKDDAFYRYKMPKMITKIEGRGNGIKTNVVNMVEIAKALGRPASYTTKYFGCELGAQSKFDEKTGTSHVNGAHDTSKLAGLLENFIKKFVQCYGCGNPETEIIITKSQMINLKCAACGFISEVDMRDKLTTFILKNPPESKKGSKDKKAMRRAEKERLKEGEVADEEQKKLKKEAAAKKKVPSGNSKDSVSKAGTKKKSTQSDEEHSPSGSQADEQEVVPAANESDEDEEDDDVQWQTDTSAVAARQTIQQQLNSVTASMVMLTPNEDKPKSNGGSSSDSLPDRIKDFLKKNAGCSPAELKSFLDTLSPPPAAAETIPALFTALFDGVGKGLSREVAKKKKYIAAAAVEGHAQQLVLLRAIEGFCSKGAEAAAKEVGLVLKALYDSDVLEEEAIVEWYGKELKKESAIWKNTKPFVEWLQSAESETEE